jgi:hypothetical protein
MKKSKHILWLIFLMLFIGGYGISCKQNSDEDLDKRIEDTKHLQGHRKEIIDGMLDGGLASRIESPSGEPYIYVTQPFYLLSKGEQASLLNVVWYYYITQDRSLDVLTVYDNDTGNEVGTFGRKGLLMGE